MNRAGFINLEWSQAWCIAIRLDIDKHTHYNFWAKESGTEHRDRPNRNSDPALYAVGQHVTPPKILSFIEATTFDVWLLARWLYRLTICNVL